MGITCPVEACNNWAITRLWHHFGFWIFFLLTFLSNMKWKSKSLFIFLSTDLSNGFLEFLFFVFHFLISCDHNYSIFRHSIGDCNVPFCLQSTSKPLIYALVQEEVDPETSHQYVGYEPSGRSFNEISLDSASKIQ
jgi:hypothetical protein